MGVGKLGGTDAAGQPRDPIIRGWGLSWIAESRESVENQRKTIHLRQNTNRQAGRGFKLGTGFKLGREAARRKKVPKMGGVGF